MEFNDLMPAIAGMTWQNLVMIAVGLTLIFLAVKKQYEPTLLLPMGFGAILVNFPFSAVLTQEQGGETVIGILNVLFDSGI
ncbi:MAG: sodium ion-translocating decarboxylase subunit beta, partial [Bacteroidales bacterium]